jgi:broad specificity phosphatase PhoE
MEQSIEFIIVRHGETLANVAGVVQGQSESELSEHGLAQARAAAVALRTYHFDACYASDLKRATDTASIILAAGHEGLAMQTDPGLREWDLGEWVGHTMTEIRATYPDLIQGFCDLGADVQIPGGESRAEFQRRINDTFDRIAAACHPGGRVLVVAHGGTLRMAICRFYGLPRDDVFAPQVDNASMTAARFYPEQRCWRLVSWNCPLEFCLHAPNRQ